MLAVLVPNPNLSYGLAIILVTLIIRIVILPLTIKQQKSTFAMNEIQPEVKKIQERYKKDPQKAQELTMKLYKEKGASPFSGCLPLLIQWPIFLALYFVFYNLQGINGVHFLWIADLTQSDMILAFLAAITTYFSGMISMPTNAADPAQAKQTKMMNIGMSIFMVFICWKLRSALVLYWVINNVIQIVQAVIMKQLGIGIHKKAEA
jgi:YidC/Oxa1 family membrane protein insertase